MGQFVLFKPIIYDPSPTAVPSNEGNMLAAMAAKRRSLFASSDAVWSAFYDKVC